MSDRSWWNRLWPSSSATRPAGAAGYGAMELINEIREARMPFGYGMWSIGVTDDLLARREQLQDPSHWQGWPVESTAAARCVLQHFAGRGMQCDTDQQAGRFVYIHLLADWRRAAA